MFRDEIELLSGRLINGSLTPTIFMLMKNTQDPDKLFKDLGVERRNQIDQEHRTDRVSGPDYAGGFSIEEWIARTGQPVSLSGNAEDAVRPNEDKSRRR